MILEIILIFNSNKVLFLNVMDSFVEYFTKEYKEDKCRCIQNCTREINVQGRKTHTDERTLFHFFPGIEEGKTPSHTTALALMY